MVEKITKDLYRIHVPMGNNPLRELNSYFIRGTDRDLLIDTGFHTEQCYQALHQALVQLNADRKRLDVLVTHLHADHRGLAEDMVGTNGRIYIGETDYHYLQTLVCTKNRHYYQTRYLAEGFPSGELHLFLSDHFPNYADVKNAEHRFTPLQEGEKLCYGNFTLQTVFTPGHTPGNCMFWVEDQGIMFTGDHILFDISPNITAWNGVTDSLGSYMRSLIAVKKYPVRLTLPGHRQSGDYLQRIDALLMHHEARLTEVEEIIRQDSGLSAYEITAKMRWRIRANGWDDFPLEQKWFAFGECLAHLDHLLVCHRIICKQDGSVRKYFIAADQGPFQEEET